ncbi:unnamed protein product [Amoebophrya sp. A120]|nr:unnamed protein product [Amoebophrya sp. A120]|eukprot:GSA120T00022677001.1
MRAGAADTPETAAERRVVHPRPKPSYLDKLKRVGTGSTLPAGIMTGVATQEVAPPGNEGKDAKMTTRVDEPSAKSRDRTPVGVVAGEPNEEPSSPLPQHQDCASIVHGSPAVSAPRPACVSSIPEHETKWRTWASADSDRSTSAGGVYFEEGRGQDEDELLAACKTKFEKSCDRRRTDTTRSASWSACARKRMEDQQRQKLATGGLVVKNERSEEKKTQFADEEAPAFTGPCSFTGASSSSSTSGNGPEQLHSHQPQDKVPQPPQVEVQSVPMPVAVMPVPFLVPVPVPVPAASVLCVSADSLPHLQVYYGAGQKMNPSEQAFCKKNYVTGDQTQILWGSCSTVPFDNCNTPAHAWSRDNESKDFSCASAREAHDRRARGHRHNPNESHERHNEIRRGAGSFAEKQEYWMSKHKKMQTQSPGGDAGGRKHRIDEVAVWMSPKHQQSPVLFSTSSSSKPDQKATSNRAALAGQESHLYASPYYTGPSEAERRKYNKFFTNVVGNQSPDKVKNFVSVKEHALARQAGSKENARRTGEKEFYRDDECHPDLFRKKRGTHYGASAADAGRWRSGIFGGAASSSSCSSGSRATPSTRTISSGSGFGEPSEETTCSSVFLSWPTNDKELSAIEPPTAEEMVFVFTHFPELIAHVWTDVEQVKFYWRHLTRTQQTFWRLPPGELREGWLAMAERGRLDEYEVEELQRGVVTNGWRLSSFSLDDFKTESLESDLPFRTLFGARRDVFGREYFGEDGIDSSSSSSSATASQAAAGDSDSSSSSDDVVPAVKMRSQTCGSRRNGAKLLELAGEKWDTEEQSFSGADTQNEVGVAVESFCHQRDLHDENKSTEQEVGPASRKPFQHPRVAPPAASTDDLEDDGGSSSSASSSEDELLFSNLERTTRLDLLELAAAASPVLDSEEPSAVEWTPVVQDGRGMHAESPEALLSVCGELSLLQDQGLCALQRDSFCICNPAPAVAGQNQSAKQKAMLELSKHKASTLGGAFLVDHLDSDDGYVRRLGPETCDAARSATSSPDVQRCVQTDGSHEARREQQTTETRGRDESSSLLLYGTSSGPSRCFGSVTSSIGRRGTRVLVQRASLPSASSSSSSSSSSLDFEETKKALQQV